MLTALLHLNDAIAQDAVDQPVSVDVMAASELR
jgi:hypothetical protein